MADLIYVQAPASKFRQFLDKLRTIGVPQKATQEWLKSIGYASSNDRVYLRVLRQLGFTDANGAPTDVWRRFRGNDHGAILATQLKTAYPDLFQTYPDAWKRSQAEVEAHFRATTSLGAATVGLAWSTFEALASMAVFEETLGSDTRSQTSAGAAERTSDVVLTTLPATPTRPSPSIHIDVQIHISPESSAEQIEQIFASMAKHIYK